MSASKGEFSRPPSGLSEMISDMESSRPATGGSEFTGNPHNALALILNSNAPRAVVWSAVVARVSARGGMYPRHRLSRNQAKNINRHSILHRQNCAVRFTETLSIQLLPWAHRGQEHQLPPISARIQKTSHRSVRLGSRWRYLCALLSALVELRMRSCVIGPDIHHIRKHYIRKHSCNLSTSCCSLHR